MQIYLDLHSRIFNWNISELVNFLHNNLKLNPDKTEFILIGNDQARNCPLVFLGNILKPAKSVNNRSVILDSENAITQKKIFVHFKEF